MMRRRNVFLDTAFAQALLNKTDTYHEQAKRLFPLVRQADGVWTTEAVLAEIGNALSKIDRSKAVRFIRDCYQSRNVHPIAVSETLFQRALDLYERHNDKEWGITDCISFVVMRDNGLTDALTTDHHFEQAGFRVLMQR